MQEAPTRGQTVTIVQVAEKPSQEISVADILLGSVGFVGLALVAAAVVGLLAGALMIVLKRLRPDNHLNGQDADQTALRLNS